jgi:cystathionine beta-lyase/cystathionine gamma-synthase
MKNAAVNPRTAGLATRAIHGDRLEAYRGPVSLPIYQTSTYRFATSKDAVRYAEGDPDVYVYTRYHNPTVRDVETRLALMEGAEAAALFASGMAALSTAVLAMTESGEEIVATPALYGGTYRFFRDELPKLKIGVRFVDPNRLEELKATISERTRVVHFETPTNPTLNIVDMKKLVDIVRREERRIGRKIVIMADNTFATILNQNPFRFGVDAVVESATKYLGGHSDVVAGVVLGSSEFIRKVKTSAKYYGGCADPFAAYLLYRSLKTFELRVERQNRNASILARALSRHRKVARVLYPGLRSHPGHLLARRQMKGFGGMLTIEVRPSRGKTPAEAAVAVCDHLRVAVNAMSLGGVETLVSIPIYSSHVSMSEEELRRHGVTPGMIRISVGVETAEDLIADFVQALEYA